MVESLHWHLDVTFREDADRTTDKDAAYNLNILKLLTISKNNISLKAKRFKICLNVEKYCSTDYSDGSSRLKWYHIRLRLKNCLVFNRWSNTLR